MPNLSLNKEALTASARRLSDHLAARHKFPLKHTHAMDALAAALGYRNRQEMTAAAKADTSASTRASTALDVHLLIVDHRHGTDTTVHETADDARDALFGYVVQWWTEVQHEVEAAVDTLAPNAAQRLNERDPDEVSVEASDLDRDEAIAAYFAVREDEGWSIDRTTLRLSTPVANAPQGKTISPARLISEVTGTGPWDDQNRVRAMEQGYALDETNGRHTLVRDPAPDLGDILHADDTDARLHAQKLASQGDATAIKALCLDSKPAGVAAPDTPLVWHECQDCGFTAPEVAMNPARQPWLRHAPGDLYTDLECPCCGALTQPVDN